MELIHLCNFERGHHGEHRKFGPVVEEEMSFKEKVYHKEQFCEIILNFGQWFRRRCCLKDFLSGALAALLLCGVKPFMQF